jgi:hypothetical protein
MEPGRDGAVILGWTGDNGDPDNFLSVLLSCASAGRAGEPRLLVQRGVLGYLKRQGSPPTRPSAPSFTKRPR